MRALGGHPLLAYTIAAARASGVFDSRDRARPTRERYAAIARHYGAEVPFLRPAAFASATSPDIEWVEHTAETARGRRAAARTASASCGRPARSARRRRSGAPGARSRPSSGVDSLRAVEKCTQHPGKMWVVRGKRMLPLHAAAVPTAQPWHSSQIPALPRGLRAEREPRDRLDARRVRRRIPSPATASMPFLTERPRRLRHQRPARLVTTPSALVARGKLACPMSTRLPVETA